MKGRRIAFPSSVADWAQEDIKLIATVDKESCHNPWPELAGPSDLRYAWSQPLCQYWYYPTTEPEEFRDALRRKGQGITLLQWVVAIEEDTHLLLHATPAKELLRLFLGLTYDPIMELIDTSNEEWSTGLDKAWNRFILNQDMLAENLERIILADELLATVVSFGDAYIARPEYRKDLTTLKEDCLAVKAAHLEQMLTGVGSKFIDLYEGFESIYRLLPRPRAKSIRRNMVLARLGIYLEPLKYHEGSPGGIEAVNCQERCERLVTAANSMKDTQQLLEWLENETVRAEDAIPWAAMLEMPLALEETTPFPITLWELARGQRRPQKGRLETWQIANLQKAYWDGFGLREIGLTLLCPEIVDEQWHVVTYPVFMESVDTGFKGDHLLISRQEGFRQQLNMRYGIRCPLYEGDRCICSSIPGMREQLHQLSRWAREGKFGDGEWTDPPPPCGEP